MKKKKIGIIIIISIIGLLGYLGYNIITKAKEKNDTAKKIQTIPNFELKTLENVSFSNANLKQNIPTIFIYFNTECDYCHHEAKSISQSLNKFKDVQFIFVSTENIEIIKQFSEKYNLNNHNKTTFLYDSNYSFSSKFNANSIPYILIYNKKQELIKKHNGQLNANGILRVLKQND
jgi:peroxiredoxin